MKSEVLFNISFIFFVQNLFNVWVWKSLLTDDIVVSDFSSLHLKFLINISAIEYAFINEGLTDQVCEKLQIACVRLNQLKLIEGYDV